MVNKKSCRLSSFHENLSNVQSTQDAAQVRRQQTFMTAHAFPRRHADSAHSILRSIAPMRVDSTFLPNGNYDFRPIIASNSANRDVVAKFADGRTGIITGKTFPASSIKVVGFQDPKQHGTSHKRTSDYSILPPLDRHAWVTQKTQADDADLTVVSCGFTNKSMSPSLKPSKVVNNRVIKQEPTLLQRQNRLTIRERTMVTSDKFRREGYSTAAFNLNRRKRTNMTDRGDNCVHHSDTHLEITNSRITIDEGLNNLTKRLQISLPSYSHKLSKPIDKTTPTVKISDELCHNSGSAYQVDKTEQKSPSHAMNEEIETPIVVDRVELTDYKTTDENKSQLKEISCSEMTSETLERFPKIKNVNYKRQNTAHTWNSWHTYRNVNESYAYNDVKQYILDNDLMPPDKHKWMTSWLENVNNELFTNEPTIPFRHSPL